jgi:menaquinol-cytochrome c reductase iron-sulfur subunit
MNATRKLVSREAFLSVIVLSVGGVATLLVGIPIIGYVLSPLIRGEPKVWRDVGAVSNFKVGETVQVNFQYARNLNWSGSTAYTSAYLRRNSATSFTAYAVYCTHLGCPVHWVAAAKIFLCPCHGSVFNFNGTVAGGPAPRPLFEYSTRIVNGRVQIQTEPQPLVGFTEA